MKRKIAGDYEFVTRVLYPRWQIRVRYDPWMDGTKWALLDHRFKRDGEWKWLSIKLKLANFERRELAMLVMAMRSAILVAKKEGEST